MTHKRSILAGAALLALTACGHSPQTRFYTLEPVPTASATTPAYDGPPLHLAALKIPSLFDRPEIARDTGASEITVDEFSHWGAPLDVLLRSALQGDLAAGLPAGKFAPDVASRQANTQDISVSILSIRTAAGETAMDVAWTQTGKDARGAEMSRSHQAHLMAGAGTTPVAYSETLSVLMGQLALTIEQGVAPPK